MQNFLQTIDFTNSIFAHRMIITKEDLTPKSEEAHGAQQHCALLNFVYFSFLSINFFLITLMKMKLDIVIEK